MIITVNQICQSLVVELVSPFFHEASNHKADIVSNDLIIQRAFFHSKNKTRARIGFVKPTWISEIRSIDDIKVFVDDSTRSLEAQSNGQAV